MVNEDAQEQVDKARQMLNFLKFLFTDHPDAFLPDAGLGLAAMLDAIEHRLTLALTDMKVDPGEGTPPPKQPHGSGPSEQRAN